MVEKQRGVVFHDDLARLNHVASIRDLQSMICILFDKKDRHSFSVELLNDLEILLHDVGASPIEG